MSLGCKKNKKVIKMNKMTENSKTIYWVCNKCGEEFTTENEQAWNCPKCASPSIQGELGKWRRGRLMHNGQIDVKIYFWKRDYADYLLDKYNKDITAIGMRKSHVQMTVPDWVKEHINSVWQLKHYDITTYQKICDYLFGLYNTDPETEGEHGKINPLHSDENQQYIKDKGAHTSMSVGDIVEINERIFLCKMSGWREIPKE